MGTNMAIARIDEEIAKHLLLVSNLRTQRNSFLPIFCLPPETLAIIFTHGAQDYHEGNDRPALRVPDWVNISYVCRHWRSVALNCPTLWSYHFNVSLRWTEELMARSKQSSLKIRIKYNHDLPRSSSWWSGLVKKVLDHAGRIEELRIQVPASFFPTTFSLFAPRLQILGMCTLGLRPPEINYGDMDTPLLRTLELSGCLPPWHSLDLSKVTKLALSHIPHPSKQDIVVFLAILSRMQALEFLALQDALARVRSDDILAVSQKVNLPRLTRLFVVAPPSTAAALLSGINILFNTQVKLEIIDDGTSIDDFGRLFVERFDQSKDPSLYYPAIRSLVVHCSLDERTLAVAASEHSECDASLPSKPYPPLERDVLFMIIIRNNESMLIRDRDRIISDICCSMPSTHIHTLHVNNPPLSPRFWRKTLGHLSGLRHMKLSDGRIPGLISLLALPVNESLATPREHVTSEYDLTPGPGFVPSLEELELRRIVSLPQEFLRDTMVARKTPSLRVTLVDCRFQDTKLVSTGHPLGIGSRSLDEIENAIGKEKFRV